MNIQARGDDGRTWRLRWQAGRDPQTGKWQRLSETFHGTRKQAEARWAERQREIERGVGVTLTGITFADLWTRWLEAKALVVRPRTLESYTALGEAHILPLLGPYRVEKLTPLDVHRAVVAWQQPAQRHDHKGGALSARTVRYCRALVVSCLDQAVKWRIVDTNVARLVDAPKPAKEARTWWTPEEGARFLQVASRHPWAIAFLLALLTGLRRGEILGLRWQDIDWEKQQLTVAQTQVLVHGKITFGPPKTHDSGRTVAINGALIRALRLHRAAQQRQKLQLGEDYHDHGLVLQTTVGTPVSPRNLSRTFAKLQIEAGVPPIRFHDMRHSHASWLLEKGVNIRTIADRLGHSQVSFTMQVYAHSRVEQQRDAVEQLSKDLWGDKWGDSSPHGPSNPGALRPDQTANPHES